MSSHEKSEKPVTIKVVTRIVKHGSPRTIVVETQEIELPPGAKLGKTGQATVTID